MLGLNRRKTNTPAEPEPVRLPAPDRRLYVVGDLHGRIDLLERMLDRIATDISARAGDGRDPTIVFVGDMIDRGDQSREVLECLHGLASVCEADELVLLKGNHEAALLRFLDAPEAGKSWLQFGGAQTLASYGVPPPQGEPRSDKLRTVALGLLKAMGDHVDFLRAMPLVYRSGDVVCAHAGLDPQQPDSTDEAALLWGSSGFLDAEGVPGLRVVHGHFDASEPVLTDRRICVDTGAYYSGRLTAAVIDENVRFLTVWN
ncbi:metallophosphoesterase family protein [Rhodovulum marinum]|uniref:Serine/threonine protein phosphatase 1 n=1 Tax=Rhodovulum marinum TaxID=320662 RepID=A0A4R2PVX6_9RHOB|nr:metallophosphoesterase family protein [Rhodovulum marinum]TCP39278.1 serine/threonine protein phosphatase 1 [Rhodovulum marinum]